jgi:replication factor A1
VPPEEARRSLLKKHRPQSSVDAPEEDHEAESAHAPAAQAGPPDDGQIKQLKDLHIGDTGITIIANVIEPEYREIVTTRGKTPVISGMLEDGTARIHFTAWVDIPDIFTTKAIVARDVYVKSFHGMPSVNINEKTVLEEHQGVLEEYVRKPRTLGDLINTDGAYDVRTEGDILSLRPGSGIIERCPQCSRVTQKGQCRAHGKAFGVKDLRIKAVLDDGTGSIICVLDRKLTQRILGTTLEDLVPMGDKANDVIRSSLIGTPVKVTGNLTKGDFGMILVATEVERPADDAADRARELMGAIR